MTNEQAKQIFNDAIANTTDGDAIANIEIVREFMTNPKFRKDLLDTTFAMAQASLND